MHMTNNDNMDSLLKSPIFKDLSPEMLAEVARCVENRVAKAGSIIFHEGDSPDGYYIVKSGRVRIFVIHDSGVERELSNLGPGNGFGEVALLTGETRTANVQAIGETHLMVVPKDDFDRLISICPELSRKFMKDIRTWLLKDQEIIEEEADQAIKESRLRWHDFLLIFGLSILLAISFNHSNPNGIPLFPSVAEKESIPLIGAAEAMEASRSGGALIVDAMPANFYQKLHIKGAVNMPMALFDIVYLMNFSEENKEREILVYGSTISKPYDMEIAGKLQLLGYTGVKVIDGGLSAWEAMGYPVEGRASK